MAKAIRQATHAMLVSQLVGNMASKCAQNVSSVIADAANENASTIMGHRARLTDLALAVDAAKESVLLLSASATGIRKAAVFMQAVSDLATATKTLIEQDRKAYNLASEPERPQDEFAAFLAEVAYCAD